MRLPLLLAGAALALGGCDSSVNTRPFSGPFLADQAESVGNAVYLLSPAGNALVRVDGVSLTQEAIPLGRDPRVLERAPGAESLFVLSGSAETLERLQPGDTAPEAVDIKPNFNSLVWSPDGRRAVAFIDESGPIAPQNDGSLNLNEIALIDAMSEEMSVEYRTLTYQPLGITFDSTGQTALIRTTDRLMVFDMDTYEDDAVRFTTEDAIRRTPSGVEVTPDDSQCVVSVSGLNDIFVLGLTPVRIDNVIGVGSSPTDMEVTHDGRTLLVATGSYGLTLVDLQSFEVSSLSLPHRVNRIDLSHGAVDPFALVYNVGADVPYITHLDLSTEDLLPDEDRTYLLREGVSQIHLAPDDSAVVLFHDAAGGTSGGAFDDYGSFSRSGSLSLFALDSRGPSHILLDAPAWDLEFLTDEAGGMHAMVLLRDSAKLVRYDLESYSATILPTHPRPTQFGQLANGTLWVSHDTDLGLVSFVEPMATQLPPGGFPAVAGAGLTNLFDRR